MTRPSRERCEHVTASGRRCQRAAVAGYTLCWQHGGPTRSQDRMAWLLRPARDMMDARIEALFAAGGYQPLPYWLPSQSPFIPRWLQQAWLDADCKAATGKGLGEVLGPRWRDTWGAW